MSARKQEPWKATRDERSERSTTTSSASRGESQTPVRQPRQLIIVEVYELISSLLSAAILLVLVLTPTKVSGVLFSLLHGWTGFCNGNGYIFLARRAGSQQRWARLDSQRPFVSLIIQYGLRTWLF